MKLFAGDASYWVCYNPLHIDDANIALHDGLYDGDMMEPSYLNYGIYTRQSFILFAEKIGIQPSMADNILDASVKSILPAMEMIERGFFK